MINRILPLLNKLIPPALAVKGLSKVDSRVSNFLTSAAAAGYGTDLALDFLRNQFEAPGERTEKERLERGASQGTLRPDEMAAREQLRQSGNVPNALQKGASIGAGLLAGGIPGAVASAAGSLGGQEEEQQQMQRQPQQIKQQPPAENPRNKGLLADLEEAHQREYGNRAQRGSNSDEQLLAMLEQALKM